MPTLIEPVIVTANRPQDVEDLGGYVEDRLGEISHALNEVIHSFFIETHVAPDKPIELMIRFADGTNWNPGAGRGLYQYISGVWTKLS